MLDKKLPMISSKRLPHPLPGGESESCCENSACCEAENTLARFYGDRRIAKERCLQVCSQAKKIDEEDLTAEMKVFKAVADATRLKILKLLSGGELCIGEIMLALKRPQSSVSHNLSILEDAGLVKERKEGKWCRYRISDGIVADMLNLAGQLKRK
ncbi:MAG: metalloregulator ArsR/SmtB family transcription factor [Methanothrix sp.]|jgi:ArsR family transcriptional regulator|nr:metalloregulator ArsR/SmtB family transcription factor [Methanothrix sp.]